MVEKIINGTDFLAERISVSHSPIRVVTDFVRTTPRINRSAQTANEISSHNLVMLDPYVAKEFVPVLSENIRKYENKSGTMEKPESLKNLKRV